MKIRAARVDDARAIAQVMVDTWRATYPGIVADDFLQSMSYQEREARWRELLELTREGERFTYVAEDEEGRILGYVSGGPERSGADPGYPGELYAIYIDPAGQGLGLGRRLVAVLAERLAESGLLQMLVWVLAANPSRTFYEKLGGRYIRAQQIEIGGEWLDEVAYGWSDVRFLITL